MALNFGFILTAFVLGSFDVAGVILVLKKGFDDVSTATKGAVLALTISATLLGGAAAVLKTDANSDGNQELYTKYMALYNRGRTYAMIGEDMVWGDIEVVTYIRRLDKLLDEYDQIYVEVDSSKAVVPSSFTHSGGSGDEEVDADDDAE